MPDFVPCSWPSCRDRNAVATVRTFGGGRYPTCLRCAGSVARAVSSGCTAMLVLDQGSERVFIDYLSGNGNKAA